jgi:hypothetical protein
MHFMNPQRATHMGAPSPAPQPTESGANLVAPQEGVGSVQSGYATPDMGPFECGNCIHFQAPNACDHPQVVSDPEVNGQVEEDGCCNLFRPAEQAEESEETQETGAIPAAGEGGQ